MLIQLHNDSTDNPVYVDREKILAVQLDKDGRTTVMVGEDGWYIYVSETVAGVIALWTWAPRGPAEPVITLKAIGPEWIAKCKAIAATKEPT